MKASDKGHLKGWIGGSVRFFRYGVFLKVLLKFQKLQIRQDEFAIFAIPDTFGRDLNGQKVINM